MGESDFKALRLIGTHYVDKSMFIKNVIDDISKVLLVTCPRRFGKTLNMSMLRYFFDINNKDEQEIFRGLKKMEQKGVTFLLHFCSYAYDVFPKELPFGKV